MEKRNYVKPETELHRINSVSFIAASVSQDIFEEENTGDMTEFNGLLDDCLQIKGSVTNADVRTYLLTQTNNTACFKGWLVDENDNPSCNDSRFQAGTGVTIQYDQTNTRFIVTFNGCTNQITNLDGSSSGGGRPGKN